MSSSFSEVQDYSAVDVDTTTLNDRPSSSKGKSPDFTQDAPQFDDDHPAPISLNPLDWMRDIRDEIKNFNFTMNERKRVLIRAIMGEGLVTFLFLFTVMAASVNNGRQENPENLVVGAIGTAFCAVAYIYSFADVSGAHFNPAVTFATMVTQKVSIRKGMAYIGIQCFAAIMATLHVMLVFPKPEDGKTSVQEAMLVKLDANVHVARAFLMEVTLSFILVYVIFATAFDTVDSTNSVKIDGESANSDAGKKLTIYTTSGGTKAGFAPLSIGLTLGFLGLLGGSVSGGCFNPARAFGPALINGNFENHWIYWIGDFIGAALAGFTQSCFAHKAVQSSANASKTNKH